LATATETFESRALLQEAKASIQRFEFRRASELLTQALKISPANPVYLSYKGHCVAVSGKMEEGEVLCRKAIQMSPNSPMLLVNLGRVLREQGKRQEARRAFLRAYEMDNTNAAAALELSALGVRRTPVLRFLHRDHPLNIWLGEVRHRLFTRVKKPRWKKL
jgi:Flp pilus assembly protein TadD